MTYTHTGYRRETGHIHSAKLYGHGDYRGKRHALNGTANTYSGAAYKAAKLIRVPKAELDKQVQLWKKRRQRKKKK